MGIKNILCRMIKKKKKLDISKGKNTSISNTILEGNG